MAFELVEQVLCWTGEHQLYFVRLIRCQTSEQLNPILH